tara:strand:- start:179 stop:595 length:417 start_codon:yes stop_codon:yes gene_type:complete
LNKKISNKDKKDWELFLSKKEKLQDKDAIQNHKQNYKTKSIDLHGYSLSEANKEIEKFIFDCYDKGVNKIIVVTGKGLHSQNENDPYVSKDLGILKYSIPDYIKNNYTLMNIINNFDKASIDDGGEGAFYILLKKKKL